MTGMALSCEQKLKKMKTTSGKYLLQNCQSQALVYTTSFGRMIFVFLFVMAFTDAIAQDSTKTTNTTKTTLQVLTRLHSGGYFPFTGSLLNHNPVADVNVFYERKSLGFFVFQSFDLKDRHSYANYFQPGVFATLKLNPTLKLRGIFGYVFSQTQSFCDKGSDYYSAATLYWDPAKHISVQNTVLYFDYTTQRKLANRLLVSAVYDRFKVDFYLWNRTVLEEKREAVSAAIALTIPVIKIGEKASINLTAQYMRYLTSYRPAYALSDGFVFTLGVPVNVKG
jgi:hypothetical protein